MQYLYIALMPDAGETLETCSKLQFSKRNVLQQRCVRIQMPYVHTLLL